MRKDVRTGAAIGLILVAVVVVYAMVATKEHSKNKHEPVVLDLGKGGSGADDSSAGAARASTPSDSTATDAATPSSAAITASPGAPGNTVVPPVPRTNDAPAAPAKNVTNWAALLSADHVEDVMPIRTRTPDPAPANVETSGGVVAESPVPVPPSEARPPKYLTETPPAPPTESSPEEPKKADKPAAPKQADPAPAPATPKSRTHKIEAGETFSSISRTEYGDSKYFREIAKANPKIDPSRLKLGAIITLPDPSTFHKAAKAADAKTPDASASSKKSHGSTEVAAVDPKSEYRVQSTDSLYKISLKLYHTPNKVDAIYQLNKQLIGPDPARLKLNMVLKLPEPPTQANS